MGTGTGKDNEGKGIEYPRINSTTRGTGTGIDKERLLRTGSSRSIRMATMAAVIVNMEKKCTVPNKL